MSERDERGLLEKLLGKIRWEPPQWIGRLNQPQSGTRLGQFVKSNASGILAVSVLMVAGASIYGWLQAHPPPPPPDKVLLSASARAPSPAPPRKRTDPVPPPAALFVEFDNSAAPLDQLNKPVTQHVTLKPELPGEWKWTTERTLMFVPQKDWPIGKHFTVSLAKPLVERPNVLLQTEELEFDTQPFRVAPPNIEFYQDPIDPAVKQVVATFSFNYPVDAASFEKRLSLTSSPQSNDTRKANHKLSISYDDLRFQAFVRSESLPLPLEDHDATVVLEPGTAPEAPGAATPERVQGGVVIPGRGNRFRLSTVTSSIARSAEGDPDQVVIFSCTSDVNEKKFAQAVKVWLLPKDLPKTKTEEAEKNVDWPNRTLSIGPEVLKLATALKPVAIPGERETSAVHSFKVDVPPGAHLFVRVEKGIEAFGGYVLLNTYEQVVTVPQYPRELRIAHEGSVLSVTGDKKLTVTARGIPAFRVQLYRIQPKDLNHLITLSSGDFAHMRLNQALSEEHVSDVFTEIKELDASNPKVAQYAAVDFSRYLKEGSEQRGMYFVSVEAWNPKTGTVMTLDSPSDAEPPAPEPEGEGYEAMGEGGEGEGESEGEADYGEGEGSEAQYGQLNDRRFVLLTDLGVVDKVDAQQNHWVFVQSFKSGNGVGSATVEVLAKNGSVVLKRSTDASGVATLPALKDFTAEKTPVALVVREGADVSFLPFNRYDRNLDFSRFDTGGVRTRGKAAALSAFAFTDRGLYRPGETAHLATIVRAVDWSKSLKGVPLELSVTDPRSLVVKKQRLTLDATGFTSIDFTPEESAPTGTYQFTVSVAEEKKTPLQLGAASFRVEEFLPDRMRMSTRFEKPAKGWLTGSKLNAIVELKNLFGTPAADHEVQASFTLSPYQPSFSQYPDFQFFDPARARRSEERRLENAQTDPEGKVSYEVDLSSYAPATYLISFYAEGFELGGGRSVSSATSVVVSPRKYLLGFKADGDTSFIKRGVERAVQVVAVDPDLKQVAVPHLKMTLVEQRYVSVLTQEASGSYRYQSVMKDVTRTSQALAISDKGSTLKLQSSEVGNFYLVIKDAEDVELLRVPYTIAGEANVAKDMERNAELKISLDKPEYEPGDTITVQITAPYAGAGIVTVERDRVYAYKAFKTSTTSTVQTIEVPAGLEANGYVNVAFVRALDSPELYTSPLSYGVVPFAVLKKSQRLEVSLKSETLARPGRPLTIKYRTGQPAKIAVFAVDEGILQVARYELPDPLAFFLARRALEVTTRQIVDQLLPEFALVHGKGKEGGDDDAAALAKNLNPFKRKGDKPAVFWSRIVDSGPDEKTVTFDVPESFAGSLRIMAVAAAPEAMASTRTATTIRGPFVIAPNTPTFLSPGDRVTVTAAIANNVEGSGDKPSVEVKLQPNAGFKLLGADTQQLTIAEGREAVATFQVEATSTLGNAELRFLVAGAKQEAARTATVSIRPASAYRVVSQAGSLRSGKTEVLVQRKMFDALAQRQLTVSLLPLSLAAGAVTYLDNYPHLCSEQLSSRAAPALVFLKRPEWGYPETSAKASFDRAFGVLRQRQNDDGSFGYWAANSFVVPWLDVYITLMLTEAKDRGVAAPAEVRVKALSALKAMVVGPPTDIGSARLKAQALYVLARNDITAPGPSAELADWLSRQKGKKNDLAHAYLASAYLLTNAKDSAQKWIEGFELNDSVVAEPLAYYDDHTYRAQVLYLISKHFPARIDAVGPKLLGLIAQSLSAGPHSLSAAWSLYALDAYATAVAGTGMGGLKHLTVEAKDNNGQWKPVSLGDALTARSPFDSAVSAFRITAADGPLTFYSLTEGGFDRDPPSSAIKEGIELIHTLESDTGAPLTQVKLGDEAVVRLSVRSLRKEVTLYNMAVVDLLPSGFELVLAQGNAGQGLARLSGSSGSWSPTQVDAREDRVIFYGHVSGDVSEVKYRVKAVAKGTFVVPPTQATGMYDPAVTGRSTSATVTVQ